MRSTVKLLFGIAAFSVSALALEPVASGAKVYIGPMEGFGTYIAGAFRVKGVPLVVVANRAVADYEVVGHSESQKAGWAKIIFQRSIRSDEQASMSVIDLRTSEVVWAYNYNMGNSYRGKQSAAESCAKHLANHIRAGGRLASSLPPLTPEQIEAAKERDEADRIAAAPQQRVIQPRANSFAPRQSIPEPTPEPKKSTSMTFTSIPVGAELFIDGAYWGTTPTAQFSHITQGDHMITVKRRGYKTWERKISVIPTEPRTIHAELETEPVDLSKPRISGLD